MKALLKMGSIHISLRPKIVGLLFFKRNRKRKTMVQFICEYENPNQNDDFSYSTGRHLYRAELKTCNLRYLH